MTDVWKLLPVFEAMAQFEIPLLVHGEVVDKDVDVFDREKEFIQRIMVSLPGSDGFAVTSELLCRFLCWNMSQTSRL